MKINFRNFLSVMFHNAAIGGLLLGVISVAFIGRLTEVGISQVDLVAEQQRQINGLGDAVKRSVAIQERMTRVLAASSDETKTRYSLEKLIVDAGDRGERIAALESLLDTQPRQIIEISRLREEIVRLEMNLVDSRRETASEFDKFYRTYDNLIYGIFIAILALIVSNALKPRNEKL